MTLLTTLKGPGTVFYVTSENGNSVASTPCGLERSRGTMERLCLHNVNNQRFLARVKYFGQAVTMDKQCRLLIPITLRNSAQMKGAVDVLDYANYLEVWNHARLMNNLKKRSNYSTDEKALNELFSAPRFSWQETGRNKEGHVHGKELRFGVHRACMGIHAVNRAKRLEALEPIRLERARVA